jgi:CRP-like cAMP-binding protein
VDIINNGLGEDAGISFTPEGDPKALTVSDEEKALIRSVGRKLAYPRGQILFAAGDLADRVYLLEQGWVRIFRLDFEGRKITVGAIRNPGELMGLAETLYHGERTCFAEAITNVVVVKLTRGDFLRILEGTPTLALRVASLLGARMREAEGKVHELICLQVPGRLALLLMKIGERTGVPSDNGTLINLRLTHEEIASMIGTTRQTVTQTLNLFKKEKSIQIDGRMIKILDEQKLARWIYP